MVKIFSNFFLLDLGCWTTTKVWTNCDQKSWPFRWQPKSSWHLSTVKIFFQFINYHFWDYIWVIGVQSRCGPIVTKNFGRSNGNWNMVDIYWWLIVFGTKFRSLDLLVWSFFLETIIVNHHWGEFFIFKWKVTTLT